MTAREAFLKIMNYEPVERIPVMALEPFEGAGIQRWRKEGLPPDVTPQEFLGMDQLQRVPIGFGPRPGFGERIISEDENYIVQLDGYMGTTVRRCKSDPTTFYGHIDHPVKNMRDWERYKEHFLPSLKDRLPPEWGDEMVKALNASKEPVGFCFYPFFFRLGFYALGMERFLTAFYETPELIHAMFSHWADLVCKMIELLPANLKIDYAVFAEDLAYKISTHLSPQQYAEFWFPYQDRVVQMLKERNVPVICQWSAGNVDPYLPSLLEHGFNCTWPLEHQANEMDAAKLRWRYGCQLRLGGNIAKEALIAGPEAIDREIERLLPLMREGGFIPALDDMVPLEVPFSAYRSFIDKMKTIRL